MIHLPNEVWLLIASYLEPQDIWVSLRNINRQLKECAEQHFEHDHLQEAVLNLPIALPTYDIRNPIRGKAVFHPTLITPSAVRVGYSDRVPYSLLKTEPEYYHGRFIHRWTGMRDADNGHLGERTRWEMNLGGRTARVCLKQAVVDDDEDSVWGCARVSFEWRSTISMFYGSHVG